MEKYLYLQRNVHLNPQEKEEEPKQFIDRLKKKHQENQEFKELFKEAKLEALGVNLTFYDKFYCPDSNRNVKDLSQLLSLTRNLNKSLQKEALVDDVVNHTFMANKGCNLMQLERSLKELELQVKPERPSTTKEKFVDRYSITNLSSTILQLNVGQAYPRKDQIKILPELDKKIEYSTSNYDYLFCRNNNIPKRERKTGMRSSGVKTGRIEESKSGVVSLFDSKDVSKQQLKTPVKKPDNISTNLSENIKIHSNLSEKTMLENFDMYFETCKPYFYFVNKDVSLSENKGLYSMNLDKHYIELKILLQNLISKFEKKNEYVRKNLFKLIYYQSEGYEKVGVMESTKLRKILLIHNTCRFYEHEFFMQIMDKYLNEKNMPRKGEVFEEYNYISKVNAIKSFINQDCYQRFFNMVSNLHSIDLEIFKKWGCIFYFMRCGLLEDCIKYLQESRISVDDEFKFIEILLKKQQLNEDFLESEYIKLNEILKTLSRGELKNPYRLGVIVLLSKTTHKSFSIFVPTFDDYIWFHLKILNISETNEILREKVLNFNYSLSEFQKFVLEINPQHFTNADTLDYVRALFSICLYEEGIRYLYENNNFLVDCINLCNVLKPLGLLKTITDESNNKLIMSNINRGVNNLPYETVLQKSYEIFVDTFIEKRFLQVVNYIKTYYDNKFLHIISNIIIKYKYYKFLLEPDSFFFNVKTNYKLIFTDLVQENQMIQLISILLEESIKTEAMKNNFSIMVDILRKYERFDEMIYLFLNGQVSIIRSKVPKQIENQFVHTKQGIILKYSDDCYRISDAFAEDFRKLKLRNNFSINAKINYKYLTQLEYLGEFYMRFSSEKFDKYEECLIKYLEKIDLIPIRGNMIDSILRNIENLNYTIRSVIPDLYYMFFFLVKKIKEKSVTVLMTLSHEKLESYRRKLHEFMNCLNNLSTFLERLISRNIIEITLLERYKKLHEMILNFLAVDDLDN